MARKEPALPRRITMGPYKIDVTTDPAMLALVGSDKPVAGFSILETGIIGISDDQGRTQAYKADTLLHELVHCAFRISGYVDLPVDEEERIVLAITTPLLHCLRANPEVVAYLTHQD